MKSASERTSARYNSGALFITIDWPCDGARVCVVIDPARETEMLIVTAIVLMIIEACKA